MKDKIKQLFQGTKEDMIIACSMLVNNYNVYDFIEDWCTETQNRRSPGKGLDGRKRPSVLFVEGIGIWQGFSNTFYYKADIHSYILCSPKIGIAFCEEAYQPKTEVINHF